MPFDNNPSTSFTLNNQYLPTGDQPKAISNLIEGTKKGFSRQTLLGVTGSGKTFTMANVISSLKRPALIIAHNKTLAAQLATEFQELLPEMPVHFLYLITITINLKLMSLEQIHILKRKLVLMRKLKG